MSAEQFITEHLDLWIEAVTSKSASGRGSNGKIELTGIKKLRELILELAVRGKLLPQDPQDESASILLAKVAAEKERLVMAGLIKKQKEQIKNPAASRGVYRIVSDKASLNARLMSTVNRMRRKRRGIRPQGIKS
jgi:type I restriction enzyme S subunit